MKPVPHQHTCPACDRSWPCANEHCADPEQHWCRNFGADNLCPFPPAWLVEARAISDAMDEVKKALYIIERYGNDPLLASKVSALMAEGHEHALRKDPSTAA